MQNLLPTVPDALQETRKRVERISNWRPDDADPVKALIDRKLVTEFTVDKVEVIKYRKPVTSKPEPNYVSPLELSSVDPSPLNASVRNEEVEESIINMEGMKVDSGIPVLAKPKKKKVSTKFDHFLYTKFYSKMPVVTDLYVQKLRTMKVMVLKPFDELLRLIEGDPKFAQFVSYNGVHMLCSPLLRSTVAMTTRREIKVYHFNKYDRIGLEVEMVDKKLTCTRVIPGTQAAAHSLYLDSAEIVGVNGERVLTLEEFQRAMQCAKQEKFFLGELPDENIEEPIILTVAAFRGGKSKIDDVYLQSFAQRERMKSLFSNIFSGGGGGRGGGRNANDDETSVNSNELGSHDESFSLADGEQSFSSESVYADAAAAAKRAVDGADAKDEQPAASLQENEDRRGSNPSHRGGSNSLRSNYSQQVHRQGSTDSVHSLNSMHSRRRRLLDSDDEDGEKGDGKQDDDEEVEDEDDNSIGSSSKYRHDAKEADEKHSAASEFSTDAKPFSHYSQHSAESKSYPSDLLGAKGDIDHGFENHMEVNTFQMQRDVDIDYEGEDGAMRANRKVVPRETVAPVVELVEEPVREPTPPPVVEVPAVPEAPIVKKAVKLKQKAPPILPFTSLVCVPPPLKGSVDWGLPESYIQFTNFSTQGHWKMELYWVDSEGALVMRHELKSGQTHMDMCTADHVWAIIARPHHDVNPKSRGLVGASSSTLHQTSSMLVQDKSMGTLIENSAADNDVEKNDTKQPLILIFRPCSMALQEGKCLSVLWTPWQSLSVSHIIYPQTSKSRSKKSLAEQTVHPSSTSSRDLPRIQPVMHIQLFETPEARLQYVGNQPNITSIHDKHMATVVDPAAAVPLNSSSFGEEQSHILHSRSGSEMDVHDTAVNGQRSSRSDHSSQYMNYSTVQRTLEDFKAAIKDVDKRYQSHRNDFENSAGAKIQRKPLVTSGALHRMRKDHK